MKKYGEWDAKAVIIDGRVYNIFTDENGKYIMLDDANDESEAVADDTELDKVQSSKPKKKAR